jgi:hypothetical protein
VSRLEESWKSGRVLRLNLRFGEDVNQQFSKEMKVERTPTWILFDAEGTEIGRWVDNLPTVEELP